MRFHLVLACIVCFFVISALAGENDMVEFAKYYCDKQKYNNNIGRADAYGGDCAHFVARAIQAGGCLPGLSKTADMWDYAAFRYNNKPYKLICVGGDRRCWIGKNWVGGLHEYLAAAGWENRGTSFNAVDYGCAVIGDPKGDARGPYSHAAFGVGPGRVAAHTSDHCNAAVSSIFQGLQAVWCPPARCQDCRCTPCEVCNNGKCQPKCGGCERCDGGRCVAKCDAGECKVCVGGDCRSKCGACEGCVGGACRDNSADRCPDKCTRCQGGDCVPTNDALVCQRNKCKRCLRGECVNTAEANSCDACSACNPDTGRCEAIPAKVNCADKCKRCNPQSGICDLPTATAAGCNGCEQCDSTTGQCTSAVAKFTACLNSNKCSTCDPANGQCKLDPTKTSCTNKCKACHPETGQCDAETPVATQCAKDLCAFCDPQDGNCKPDPAKTTCTDKCKRCNSATGECDLPTDTANSCNPCQRCDSTTGQCVDDTTKCADDKCFKCNAADGGKCTLPRDTTCAADKCLKCNPESGVCDVPRNLSCVANKCFMCDSASGMCVSRNVSCNGCQACDPASGTCADAGRCNKCQRCIPGADATAFRCEAIEDKCKSCEWCDGISGECKAVKCAECAACDVTLNQCAPTPNVPCGADVECNMCDTTGRCVALNDDITCSSQNTTVCEEAKCVAGRCAKRPNAAAVNAVECAPGGECYTQLCQADGSCKLIPKAENISCSETMTDQCNVGKCAANGTCITIPLSGNPCASLQEVRDRNVTLCRDFVCEKGQCITVPRTAGTNCTHRNNETDLEETICTYSICDGAGMCVANETSPFCVTRTKRKATAAIVGGVVGGVLAVAAAVAVGLFVAAKASPAVAAGMGMDSAFAGSAVNPTYVQMAENVNPTYA